jgi:hypothetical protein
MIGFGFWFVLVLFVILPLSLPIVAFQAHKAEWGHRVKNG